MSSCLKKTSGKLWQLEKWVASDGFGELGDDVRGGGGIWVSAEAGSNFGTLR
jgi:hypothetical protein